MLPVFYEKSTGGDMGKRRYSDLPAIWRDLEVYALDDTLPHADKGGWKGFLETCDMEEHQEVIHFYGHGWNYLLFPNGAILTNCGHWGEVMANRIEAEGWREVFNDVELLLARSDWGI
jgi:hypothetical protein